MAYCYSPVASRVTALFPFGPYSYKHGRQNACFQAKAFGRRNGMTSPSLDIFKEDPRGGRKTRAEVLFGLTPWET
jgi:hypothetical protein